MFEQIDDIIKRLAAVDDIVDGATALSVQVANSLSRPLLLEGETGVGKTSLA